MILLIDNYDSFTYNLYQYIGTINPDIKVVRNDQVTVKDIEKMPIEKIILSPGPGEPKDAGICEEVIRIFGGKIPILGVCLGHQAICEAYGGRIVNAKKLMHGKKSEITIDNTSRIYKGLPEKIEVARYHSLVLDKDTLPDVLKITSRDEDGEIMSVEHENGKIFGVQFHPESIMTKKGMDILKNFLEL
ncbi:anthranilate synthase component II [Butyrivibrio sp. NC3005]|uniref:anthranilate synthase component II n=1 Tax=Butyrivibrio sp. NC3005 TaxID=1280685 RepID=UPI000411BEB6|nr:aminodeoxychorismate/anthranilate synthase component II [Butyrivibrio sp. NC3005]